MFISGMGSIAILVRRFPSNTSHRSTEAVWVFGVFIAEGSKQVGRTFTGGSDFFKKICDVGKGPKPTPEMRSRGIVVESLASIDGADF